MMLNWWKNMPLVLVSPEYLQACGAKVYFLKDSLTPMIFSMEMMMMMMVSRGRFVFVF
jgi:hypothetical protein